MREQRVVLKHVATPALLGWGERARRRVDPHVIAERDPAAIRPDRAGNQAQNRRLARPGRSRKRETAPRLDGERHLELEVGDAVRELSLQHG